MWRGTGNANGNELANIQHEQTGDSGDLARGVPPEQGKHVPHERHCEQKRPCVRALPRAVELQETDVVRKVPREPREHRPRRVDKHQLHGVRNDDGGRRNQQSDAVEHKRQRPQRMERHDNEHSVCRFHSLTWKH